MAIAQGLTEAWSQVLGRVPLEITRVTLGEDGDLGVVATDGKKAEVLKPTDYSPLK